MDQSAGGICSGCGRMRPLEQLVAFWPVGDPARRAFVCRPSDPVPPFMNCFRDTVSTVDVHEVGPAAAGSSRVAA